MRLTLELLQSSSLPTWLQVRVLSSRSRLSSMASRRRRAVGDPVMATPSGVAEVPSHRKGRQRPITLTRESLRACCTAGWSLKFCHWESPLGVRSAADCVRGGLKVIYVSGRVGRQPWLYEFIAHPNEVAQLRRTLRLRLIL